MAKKSVQIPKDKKLKKLFFGLIACSLWCNAQADSFLSKPFPTCPNIRSFMAHETATAVKSRCDTAGVNISMKKWKAAFESMLTEEFASPTECARDCLLLNATAGKDMASCVEENMTKPFVDGIVNSGKFDKTTCLDFKRRFVK